MRSAELCPPPTPLTATEKADIEIDESKALTAIVRCLADQAGRTEQQVRDAIKAKLP